MWSHRFSIACVWVLRMRDFFTYNQNQLSLKYFLHCPIKGCFYLLSWNLSRSCTQRVWNQTTPTCFYLHMAATIWNHKICTTIDGNLPFGALMFLHIVFNSTPNRFVEMCKTLAMNYYHIMHSKCSSIIFLHLHYIQPSVRPNHRNLVHNPKWVWHHWAREWDSWSKCPVQTS